MKYKEESICPADIQPNDHIIVSSIYMDTSGKMVAGLGKPTSRKNFHLKVIKIIDVTKNSYRSYTGKKIGLQTIQVETTIGIVHFTNKQKIIRTNIPYIIPR